MERFSRRGAMCLSLSNASLHSLGDSVLGGESAPFGENLTIWGKLHDLWESVLFEAVCIVWGTIPIWSLWVWSSFLPSILVI